MHDSLQWTGQQKRNSRNYQIGHRILFTRSTGTWKKGDTVEVRNVSPDGKITIAAANGDERRLALRSVDSFDVGKSRSIECAAGDKILIRANAKNLGLINGQVLTVARIEADQSIQTREGIRIPHTFRQWCHGYVVTSHKSQGRTCDHVVIAAERLDAKAAYVACSRGRPSCTMFISDKQRLKEHLPEGSRRAALDVCGDSVRKAEPTIPVIASRVQAWAKHLPINTLWQVKRIQRQVHETIESVRKQYQLWRKHREFRNRCRIARAGEQVHARTRTQ